MLLVLLALAASFCVLDRHPGDGLGHADAVDLCLAMIGTVPIVTLLIGLVEAGRPASYAAVVAVPVSLPRLDPPPRLAFA